MICSDCTISFCPLIEYNYTVTLGMLTHYLTSSFCIPTWMFVRIMGRQVSRRKQVFFWVDLIPPPLSCSHNGLLWRYLNGYQSTFSYRSRGQPFEKMIAGTRLLHIKLPAIWTSRMYSHHDSTDSFVPRTRTNDKTIKRGNEEEKVAKEISWAATSSGMTHVP